MSHLADSPAITTPVIATTAAVRAAGMAYRGPIDVATPGQVIELT